MKTLIAIFAAFAMLFASCTTTENIGEKTYRDLEYGGVSARMLWRSDIITEISYIAPVEDDKGNPLPLYVGWVTLEKKVDGKKAEIPFVAMADSNSKFVAELLLIKNEQGIIKGRRKMSYCLPNEENIKEVVLQNYIRMMNAKEERPSKQQLSAFQKEINTYLEYNYVVIQQFDSIPPGGGVQPNRYNGSSSYNTGNEEGDL